MAAAARLPLPLPEAGVVEGDTLPAQTGGIAAALPERPVVLGGCCCAHTGAIRGLSARVARLGVVWLDAHGDLNTPETSPSGNAWGMPLRVVIDGGDVRPADVALVGARNLDPPEVDYLEENGIGASVPGALDGVDAVYVAFDADVLDERVVGCFMPEPNGLTLAQAEDVLRDASERVPLAGIGFTGLTAEPGNVQVLVRLLDAVGLPPSPPARARPPD
jgi:arginase family enzyme